MSLLLPFPKFILLLSPFLFLHHLYICGNNNSNITTSACKLTILWFYSSAAKQKTFHPSIHLFIAHVHTHTASRLPGNIPNGLQAIRVPANPADTSSAAIHAINANCEYQRSIRCRPAAACMACVTRSGSAGVWAAACMICLSDSCENIVRQCCY